MDEVELAPGREQDDAPLLQRLTNRVNEATTRTITTVSDTALVYINILRVWALRLIVLFAIVGVMVAIATLIYSVFYAFYVPVRSQHRPVYFQFYPGSTRNPSGLVELTQDGRAFLYRNQAYDISVDLVVPESEVNRKLGMVMMTVDLLSITNRTIHRSSRPFTLQYQNSLLETMSTLAYGIPLLLGLSEQAQHLHVPMMESVRDTEYSQDPIASIFVTLSRNDFEVYRAQVNVVAQLSGLRYIMHNWFVLSSFVGIGLIVLWEMAIVGFAALVVKLKQSELEQQQQQQEEQPAHAPLPVPVVRAAPPALPAAPLTPQRSAFAQPRRSPSASTSPKRSVRFNSQVTVLQPQEEEEEEDDATSGGASSSRGRAALFSSTASARLRFADPSAASSSGAFSPLAPTAGSAASPSTFKPTTHTASLQAASSRAAASPASASSQTAPSQAAASPQAASSQTAASPASVSPRAAASQAASPQATSTLPASSSVQTKPLGDDEEDENHGALGTLKEVSDDENEDGGDAGGDGVVPSAELRRRNVRS